MNVAVDPFDVPSLFALRALLRDLDPDAAPGMRTLAPPPSCRSVAILPGSFNPPTAAHVLLAERARAEGYDCVVFVLARATVGKAPMGLIPEDRLLAVRAAVGNGMAIAACSHGLYADQAEAAARLFPDADIAFLVGSDKVTQIFEHQWYDDRDAVLERFFERAHLVFAPRSDQQDGLRGVLSAPENERWRQRVRVLRLHPAVGDLSSTRVRGLLRAGADPAGLVPPGVADLLAAVRAFAPPVVVGAEEVDLYAARARLIDLLWARGRDAPAPDLRALVRAAGAPGAPGRRLRALLADGGADPDELLAAAGA